MRRYDTMFGTLEVLPAKLAWTLIDTLRPSVAALIAEAGPFVVLGLIGYWAGGSRWYLAAAAAAAALGCWRTAQVRAYASRVPGGEPLIWARRFRRSLWASAALWGGWSVAVAIEPRPSMAAMVIGTQAVCLLSSTVRARRFRGLALGQVLLAWPALAVACLFSPDMLLRLYAPLVVGQFAATFLLIQALHEHAERIIHMDAEKSALLEQLDIAIEQHDDANQRLEELAATDALTGAANRRAFDEVAGAEWRRGARTGQPLSLLMLDVDHFKTFNDTYGHQAGDGCLREIVRAIGSVVHRPGDLIARYGGEEFAVVLPATSSQDAVELAEKILLAVIDRNVAHVGNPRGHVTISIGVATMLPIAGGEVEPLIASADAALYAAKREGRACVRQGEGRSSPVIAARAIGAGLAGIDPAPWADPIAR